MAYSLDDQVGFLLRLASQRHAAIFAEHAPHGLTPTQFSTLIRLSEYGTCSQNELGRRAGMDAATIKGVVDRLRQKGFVETHASPTDRRRMDLSLTETGQGLIASLKKTGRDISEATLAPLDDSERNALISILRKLG